MLKRSLSSACISSRQNLLYRIGAAYEMEHWRKCCTIENAAWIAAQNLPSLD